MLGLSFCRHLATRNAADPRFVAELIALGARTDLKNESGELPADLDRATFDSAFIALENRQRERRVDDDSFDPTSDANSARRGRRNSRTVDGAC